MGNYRTWAQNADANPLSAQLAERDAEIAERGIAIAALKAELADSQTDVAQLLTTVEQQRQHIERLKAQVAQWTELHKLNVALPERSEDDAKIAQLRAQVETMIQAQAYAENTILRQRRMMDAQKRTASDAIAERDASIARMERQLSDNLAKAEMLRAQVAELEAWKAAVPVTPIERYICDGYEYGDDDPSSSEDWKAIMAWLDAMAPD